MQKKEDMATRTYCDGCDELLCEIVNHEVSGGNHRYVPLTFLQIRRGNQVIVNLDMCTSCIGKLLPLLPEVAKKAIVGD